MSLLSKDDFIDRVSDGFSRNEPIYHRQPNAQGSGIGTTNPLGVLFAHQITKTVPTLETGVTGYVPTYFSLAFAAANSIQACGIVFGKTVKLGSLNLSTNTFTDGANMGTRLEGNTSTPMWSPVFARVASAITGTSLTLSITYTDQDGNTGITRSGYNIAAASIGAANWIDLQSNSDIGARDITAASVSGTSPAGTLEFYGIIPIGMDYHQSVGGLSMNFMEDGLSLIQLLAGDDVGVLKLSGAASGQSSMFGNVVFVGDN